MTWSLPIGLAAAVGVLALVLLGLVLYVRRGRRFAAAFGDRALLRRLLDRDPARVPWTRALLLMGGATALAVALLDPRWGTAEGGGEGEGGPVVLVIDVSSSMLVEDVAPSRLAVARAAAGRIVRELGDVPVGVVVFAGRAYALSPPTRDAGAVDLYLDALDPGMVTQTGSALSGALRQGVGLLLSGDQEPVGTLVILSDGNVAEAPEDLQAGIDLARRAGIPVHTVGIGTPRGGAVPDIDVISGARVGFKQEADGSVVESRLDEAVLRRIAEGTGGVYLRGDADAPDRVAELARRPGGSAGGGPEAGAPRFAWFAAAALLLLLLERLVDGPRRGAVAGAVAVCVGLSACAESGGVGEGGVASRDSVAHYRELAATRPADPAPLYNLGTVLLQRQRFEEARAPLERAARTTDLELRRRARYNLGNSRLEPAFAERVNPSTTAHDREQRAEALRAAAESYREALRLEAADEDAKWNLELTLRLLDEARVPPPEPPDPPEPEGDAGGGGGGGGGSGGGGGGESRSADQDPRPQGGGSGVARPEMTRAEAEELLSNARERELGVQRETLRKPQPANSTAH